MAGGPSTWIGAACVLLLGLDLGHRVLPDLLPEAATTTTSTEWSVAVPTADVEKPRRSRKARRSTGRAEKGRAESEDKVSDIWASFVWYCSLASALAGGAWAQRTWSSFFGVQVTVEGRADIHLERIALDGAVAENEDRHQDGRRSELVARARRAAALRGNRVLAVGDQR